MSELSDGTLPVGAVGLSGSGMTDHDMGYRPCLSEGTVGLSYGSCRTVIETTVGLSVLSVLCRCSVGYSCRTVGPGLNMKVHYKRLNLMLF